MKAPAINIPVEFQNTPAAKVIKAFGGFRPTALALDVDSAWVWHWLQPKDKKGTGGVVPSKHQAKILKLSNERGLGLTPADLIGEPVGIGKQAA